MMRLMTLDDLEVQRTRADRAYQALARSRLPGDWKAARDGFQVENDRLIALELRWANRKDAT